MCTYTERRAFSWISKHCLLGALVFIFIFFFERRAFSWISKHCLLGALVFIFIFTCSFEHINYTHAYIIVSSYILALSLAAIAYVLCTVAPCQTSIHYQDIFLCDLLHKCHSHHYRYNLQWLQIPVL